jgi:hypothetical protein
MYAGINMYKYTHIMYYVGTLYYIVCYMYNAKNTHMHGSRGQDRLLCAF